MAKASLLALIFVSTSILFPLSAQAGLREIDAMVIDLVERGTKSGYQRALAPVIAKEGVDAERDLVTIRASTARALDQLATLDRSGLAFTPEAANLLVDLFTSFESAAKVEKDRGVESGLNALANAVWRAKVDPLAAHTETDRRVALTDPLGSRLIGQWLSAGKTAVRVLDLWATPEKRKLVWAHETIDQKLASSATLLKSSLLPGAARPDARLALYVDVAWFERRDVKRFYEAANARGDDRLRLIIDDSDARFATCLGVEDPKPASKPDGKKAPASTKGRKPSAEGHTSAKPSDGLDTAASSSRTSRADLGEGGGTSLSELRRLTDDPPLGGPAEDPLVTRMRREDHCRSVARSAGPKYIAVLFDPSRHLRVREFEPGTERSPADTILTTARNLARYWP